MSRKRFTASVETPLVDAVDQFAIDDRRGNRNAALNELLHRHPEIQKILARGVSHQTNKKQPKKASLR